MIKTPMRYAENICAVRHPYFGSNTTDRYRTFINMARIAGAVGDDEARILLDRLGGKTPKEIMNAKGMTRKEFGAADARARRRLTVYLAAPEQKEFLDNLYEREAAERVGSGTATPVEKYWLERHGKDVTEITDLRRQRDVLAGRLRERGEGMEYATPIRGLGVPNRTLGKLTEHFTYVDEVAGQQRGNLRFLGADGLTRTERALAKMGVPLKDSYYVFPGREELLQQPASFILSRHVARRLEPHEINTVGDIAADKQRALDLCGTEGKRELERAIKFYEL